DRHPLRLRQPRRPAQRGQVDPDQRPGGREDRDHLQPPADHPARSARHRHPGRRAAGPGRHARAAPAADAARRAAERGGPRDLGRRGRHRAVPAGRRAARAGRPLPGPGAVRPAQAGGRGGDEDRPAPPGADHRGADRRPAAGRAGGAPVRRHRAGVRGVGLPGRPAGRPADRPSAGGAGALPGQRADRRADRDPDRRAGPGGRAGGGPGRAAALAGGVDRRDAGGGWPDRHPRDRARGAGQPEADRARLRRLPAALGRHPGAARDRGAARRPGLPGPARERAQGLAARPAPAPPPRVL
ncbi:MAG: GTP-binding protein Era, partial [uncultured Corynebacteriales bacterium]